MSKKQSFDDQLADLENEKEQIDFQIDNLLRREGWEHSSSHPGCMWLWSKRIRGRMYHVPKETALRMSRCGYIGGGKV
jgi:hypothetical protein